MRRVDFVRDGLGGEAPAGMTAGLFVAEDKGAHPNGRRRFA